MIRSYDKIARIVRSIRDRILPESLARPISPSLLSLDALVHKSILVDKSIVEVLLNRSPAFDAL